MENFSQYASVFRFTDFQAFTKIEKGKIWLKKRKNHRKWFFFWKISFKNMLHFIFADYASFILKLFKFNDKIK